MGDIVALYIEPFRICERSDNIMNSSKQYVKLGAAIVIAVILAIIVAATTTIVLTSNHRADAFLMPVEGRTGDKKAAAPMATSGNNNVYVAWWSNKTGNDEVMFKASTDGGKTFANKMNLSNTPKSESQDVEISAAGNNVYVTWWERNQTMNEPVMRVSNDNGKTFGKDIMLSTK
jgi:hypothetical protein